MAFSSSNASGDSDKKHDALKELKVRILPEGNDDDDNDDRVESAAESRGRGEDGYDRLASEEKDPETKAREEFARLKMRKQISVLVCLVADFLVTVAIYVFYVNESRWGNVGSDDVSGFTFDKSLFDMIVLCAVRVVMIAPFAAMCRSSPQHYQSCCGESDVAYWIAVVSAMLVLCKFLLVEWTVSRGCLLVFSFLVCVAESIFISRADALLRARHHVLSKRENEVKKKTEDARAFFYDDPEAHVSVNYTRLWVLFRPYFWPDERSNRVRALIAYACMLGSQACTVIAPFYIGYAANSLGGDSPDFKTALQQCGIYVGLNYAAQQLTETQNCVYQEVRSSAYRTIASTIFEHLLSLSIDWHLKKRMGVALRVIDRGQTSADNVVKYLVLRLVPAIAGIIAVCVLYVVKFDVAGISIVLFLGIFLYSLLTVKLTIWRKEIRKKTNIHDNRLHDVATDCLTNIETVKFFCSEKFEEKVYATEIRQYQKYTNHTQYSLSVLNLAQQATKWVTTFFMLYIAAYEIDQKKMQVGDFVTVLSFASSMFSPLSYLGTIYGMIVQAFVDLLNVLQLLLERPDVEDAPNAKSYDGSRGDIVFENVSFRYPTQAVGKGLRGISFTVPAGTTTALVGTTGAGKTTIGRLLFRFYDVDSGRILINGQDISTLTKLSVRESIGMVPQEKSLFNKSVAYNLRYGRRDATKAELVDAARSAQILNFIESLEFGWDTVVGERGLKLSGGEKQRVAIARALLKDPPYVVLDEATSALDTVTERAVQQALSALAKGRTQLIIAHRLSTIRGADQIIVLDDGKIVERGTHASLISKNGKYKAMLLEEEQMREEAEDVSASKVDSAK